MYKLQLFILDRLLDRVLGYLSHNTVWLLDQLLNLMLIRGVLERTGGAGHAFEKCVFHASFGRKMAKLGSFAPPPPEDLLSPRTKKLATPLLMSA